MVWSFNVDKQAGRSTELIGNGYFCARNRSVHSDFRILLKGISEKLTTYCISYDLTDAQPEEYAELIDHLKTYPTWWHHLESTWFIVSEKKVSEIRDECRVYLPSGSKLIVISVGDTWAGKGFSERAYNWLKTNWNEG